MKKRKQSAIERYHKALRSGDADAIAAAAELAGVDSARVETDIALLERAAALGIEAGRLGDLERAKTDAVKEFERAGKALDAAIAKLQPVLDAAAWQAGVADRAVTECRSVVNTFATLYRDHADLLPLADAPPPVREFLRAEAASQTAGQIRAASDRRAKVAAERLSKARELEQRITAGTWPWDETNGMFNVSQAERSLRDGSALAQAKKAVAEAEAELVAAQAGT